MATIKSFTDLKQSKVLAKILSFESADMYYQYLLPKSSKIKHNPEIGNPVSALKWYNKGYITSGKEPITLDEYCVPCWSLAALLNVLPSMEIERVICSDNTYDYRVKVCIGNKYTGNWYSNPIDACVDTIVRLHESNLL